MAVQTKVGFIYDEPLFHENPYILRGLFIVRKGTFGHMHAGNLFSFTSNSTK